MIRIHESHTFVLRKIHFKQMKIIAVYNQLKQLRNKVSQRSWVRFPFRPEFFSGLISQLLKLSIYCDDLHLLKKEYTLSLYLVSLFVSVLIWVLQFLILGKIRRSKLYKLITYPLKIFYHFVMY